MSEESLYEAREALLVSYRKMHSRQRRAVYNYLVSHYGEHCVQCGATEELTIDHIVPLSLGGTHKRRNCQLLCYACNQIKGATVFQSIGAAIGDVEIMQEINYK